MAESKPYCLKKHQVPMTHAEMKSIMRLVQEYFERQGWVEGQPSKTDHRLATLHERIRAAEVLCSGKKK